MRVQTLEASRHRMLCPTLVGRQSELAALDELLAEAATGRGRVAIVGGDAGIGKSRLLEAFLGHARATGAKVVAGQCVETEARRPFGPFIAAFGGVVQGTESVLPYGDTPIADEDARRALRSFATVLVDLARDRTLVAAIEDLHWADEGTLELFSYLARVLADRPILLIATYRSDELHRLHPLRPVLASLARARLADTVMVRSLTREETREIVHATLGQGTTLRAGLLEAIEARCEGNPFFVEEVLKALAEAGHLAYREHAWREEGPSADLVIPASIRDAVQDRLALLPQQTRNVVQIAAVIGTFFDFSLLAQISEMPDDRLIAALREAIDAQLIVEAPTTGADAFRFRHALTRESVLSELLGRERRLLHARIAAALQRASGRDPEIANEELAYHFDEAGVREEAFRYHEVAARRAERLFAFGAACRHLERALELASNDADIATLELRFAQAAVGVGDGRRALPAAENARRRFGERQNVRRAGLALCAAMDAYGLLGRADEAQRAGEAAIAELEPLGATPELGEAYRRMALLCWRNAAPTVEPWATRAIELGRKLDLPYMQAWGLIGLGGELAQRGNPAGMALLEDALKIGLDQESPNLVFVSRLLSMSATTFLGRPPAERRGLYEAAVDHAAKHGYRDDLLLVLMVEEAVADGEFDRAMRLALQVGSDSIYGAQATLRVALVQAARTGRSLPGIDAARTRLLSGAQQVRAFAAYSAQPLLLLGEARSALQHLDAAADRLAEGSRTKTDEVAPICAIEAARRLGDEAAIERWIELALSGERAFESRVRRGGRAFARAERAHRAGMLDQAVEYSALSVEHVVGDQWPFVETLARLRHAELLLERAAAGDAQAAKAELSMVVAFWRRAGAPWYLGKLREWAREHGVGLPAAAAGRATGRTALTPREREIAQLVADGLNNPQIAERLVISARTAESHVQRIMEKLEMHNRTEVAVWAAAALRP